MNVCSASVGYGLRYSVSPSLCGDGVSRPLFTYKSRAFVVPAGFVLYSEIIRPYNLASSNQD